MHAVPQRRCAPAGGARLRRLGIRLKVKALLVAGLAGLAGFAPHAWAEEPSDLDALALADAPTTTTTDTVRDWQAFAELAFGQFTAPSGVVTPNHRLSLDVQVDTSIAPRWRAVLADRLDGKWPGQIGDEHYINTLKEAYVSWQASDERLLDLGRVNVRNGVAMGYNPTDYFRSGAVRSMVSSDPGSLKKNRLGSVMLRGQTLWNGGSLTALASPKMAEQASDTAFSPDYGATNNQNRWLLSLSQRLTDKIAPQWLLYGEDRQSAQLGMNLTTLAGDATVLFAEWSGGQSRSQLAQAGLAAEDASFHQRAAAGVTYTTRNKLSMTLEYAYNDAALHADEWDALQRGWPLAYAQYRLWAQAAQELPTRDMLGLYANWQDAVVPHLDISAMLRTNRADNSRTHWVEARYHWSHTDVALQLQVNSGGPLSDFGATPQQRIWQVSLRQYF
ncbi:MAG: hypothetical protein IPN06_18470 [Burkholderiales bacterium]|nr:hypothetical protein [Burkholderiales bacterium]